MTEKSAFKQVRWQASAIDSDKSPFCAITVGVDRFGDQFFPSSTFTLYEHRAATLGHQGYQVENL